MTLEREYALGMMVAATPPAADAGPERLRAVVSEPSRAVRVRDTWNGGLTPREREIAALVATGRTNRQIADELVLSGRTVDAHVRNILGKLDLSRRAQIAVWAIERGLGTGSRQP